MPEQFDPYYVWLGIPPKDQPPNHYRLLGLELFEDNLDVIDAATNRQTSYLHEMATGPNRKYSQELLNQIAAARSCLLDSERKVKYDRKLRKKFDEKPAAEAPSSSESDSENSSSNTEKAKIDPAESDALAALAAVTTAGPADGKSKDDVDQKPQDKPSPEPQDETSGKSSKAPQDETKSKNSEKSKNEKKEAGKADSETSGKSPATTKKKQSSWIVPACVGGAILVMSIVLVIVLGGDDEAAPIPDGQQTAQNDNQPDGSDPENNTSALRLPQFPDGSQSGLTPDMEVAGLLANWRFDEKPDEQVIDSGDGKRDATLEGKPGFADGPYGPAVQLNGRDERVVVPAGVFNEAEGTLALWVRADVEEMPLTFVDTAGGQFSLSLDNRNALVGSVGTGETTTISSLAAFEHNQWYHVALTWKSEGPVSLFCNAEPVGTLKKVGKLAAPTEVAVGQSLANNQCSAVSVDDVRVFGRALAKTDLQELIKEPAIKLHPPLKTEPPAPPLDFSPDNDGLVVRYEFSAAEKLVTDAKGQDSAINHGATFKEESLNLDGKDDWFEVPGAVIQKDFMISFWMKTTQTGPATSTWTAGNRVIHAGDALFGISLVDDRLVFGTGGKGSQSALSKTIINDGAWHFVVVTRTEKDGKLALIIDGTKESSENVVAAKGPFNVPKITVGRSVDKADKFFAGQLADLRFYSRVLNPDAEIMTKVGGARWKTFDASRPKPPPAAPVALPTGTTTGTIYQDIYAGLAEKSLKPLLDAVKPAKDGGTKPTNSAARPRGNLSLWMNKDCAKTGRRVTGFLVPPLTGPYRFSTRISDHGRFRISPNESRSGLAAVNGEVQLKANQLHFFELLFKCDDDSGGYNISWILPNGAQETPIPASRFTWIPHQREFVTLPVTPREIKSDKENTFKAGENGTVLVSGTGRGSTFDIKVRSLIGTYTAFRIDAIPDATSPLPSGGPGMGGRGVYSIADVSLTMTHPNAGAQASPVTFKEPLANAGGPPRAVTDGNSDTRWSVRDGGQASSLILQPDPPLAVPAGATLTFRIICEDNLGSFALRATSVNGAGLARHLSGFSTAPTRRTTPTTKRYELYVNLGGTKAVTDPKTKISWQPSRGWKAGSWGHSGGKRIEVPASQNPSPVQRSCIEGLTSFKATVPNGGYYVVLFFCENWQQQDKRNFTVQFQGAPTPFPVKALAFGFRKGGAYQRIPVIVKDGVLQVTFKGAQGQNAPILNAISIMQR